MIRSQSRSGSSRSSSACTGDLRILASVGHNQRVERETAARDVGVVLSGGAINGVLMECGFLKRLRETALWPRIACIFGTSAGALSGAMAALDRLEDLEAFLLALQPHETFRPNPLWRQPFLGLHSYARPRRSWRTTRTSRSASSRRYARTFEGSRPSTSARRAAAASSRPRSTRAS